MSVQVLAEPIQTVMRKHAAPEPYEQLKAFTRGAAVSDESLRSFVDELEGVPEAQKIAMKEWSPQRYIGNAAEQAKQIRKYV